MPFMGLLTLPLTVSRSSVMCRLMLYRVAAQFDLSAGCRGRARWQSSRLGYCSSDN